MIFAKIKEISNLSENFIRKNTTQTEYFHSLTDY